MRKLFLLAATAAVLAATAPAWASWSLVANNVNGSCVATSATCAVTVTSTTAGDIAIVTMRQANTTDVISSVSDGSSTYALCPGSECHGSDATLGRGLDMAYSLSLVAGKTSVTITRSSTTNSGTWLCRVLQYRTTSGPASYDKGGNRDQNTAVANPAGVALAITGTSDVIVQAIVGNTPTAISGSFTDPATFSANDGWGGWINANSGAAPTWTQTLGRAVVSAIAISETAAPAPRRKRVEVTTD